MGILGKKRKCRYCSKEYLVPSEYPGTCSEECFSNRRNGLKSKLNSKKALSDNFFTSRRWLSLRFNALIKYGRRCSLCKAENTELHVDHIKPRSKYPELAYSIDNLQILCKACNLGKGSKISYDRF